MGVVAGHFPSPAASKEWLFVSVLPSGGLALGTVSQGWWLVVDEETGPGRIVAGPFPDRAEARWAESARTSDVREVVRTVYGTRRNDGGLSQRPSPQDWTWLAHLGDQLDRLVADWDATISDEDPLTTLVVEVAGALAEAGLPLHDVSGPGSEVGGACLSPEPGLGGVLVTWRQHDRMTVEQVAGATVDAVGQQVMNAALAELLRLRGFQVSAFGGGSGSLVRPAL
ncbi:hypothetical protein SAMN06272739_0790 [Blastococcus haudaquaticus]|uniref:Uncharacterized protein n=1 Tax=Blastococcus haudaquaticus TaxID=1938745 RepID=A0A286GH23_9ACTN|nr:hypothetical protein SAMN06272739_0790 [Blastococcus haudaquaticus]